MRSIQPNETKPATLGLSRPLAIATHNLHLVRRNSGLIIQLEVDIFDKEGPNLIAEAIGIEVALFVE